MRINDVNSTYSFSGIYMIKNNINNKVYIGQSKNIYKRFLEYRKNRFNTHLSRAISKYGLENFFVFVLEKNISLDNLNDKEQYWIDYYQSYNVDYGYNMRPIAESMRGYKHSESTKKDISNKMLGNTNAKGNILSDTTRKNISDSKKGWKPSETHLKALQEGCIKASRKKIMQIDKNTNEIIKIWDSLSEACDELKIHITLLSLCLHNKRKSTGGFKWKLVS